MNSLENNVKSLCIKFSEKLNSKILIEPANDCAYDVYQILRQNKNADIIILDLKELLFGAMLDEFNSLTKNYFRNPEVLNKSNSFKAEKILLKIINLIGDKSPFYKSLQARWLFIKAINEQEKSPKESLKLLSESIKIEEDASYNNNQLGKLYIKLGDYEKAKDCLLACIESSPKWSYGYNKLGVVYFKTGKIDSATSCFIDAINLNNNEAAFYSNYGNCFAVKKDYKKAINCYNNALKLNPNFIEAYSNRGSVYYADGNYSQAILDFTKAIQFDPKNGY
ncbi:MAG: tetratricopeptide repeat protein, partial [Ignavibacteriae bacterium]|nr:tetratricopeptide repeat protein [Ignavibacteriota bacterium]